MGSAQVLPVHEQVAVEDRVAQAELRRRGDDRQRRAGDAARTFATSAGAIERNRKRADAGLRRARRAPRRERVERRARRR